MKKINADLVAAMISTILALVFLTQSFQYDYHGPTGLGPGFFAVWLSGIVLVLSLIYVFQAIRRQGSSDEEGVLPKGEALKKMLICVVSMIVFVVLFYFLGFFTAATVFLFILLYRAYRWYVSLGISVGVSLSLFWLFGTILSVDLPFFGQ